jgi:hypothetical protein
MKDDRVTPLPPARVKLASGTLERPKPDADAREWGFFFANVAVELDNRMRRTHVPRWHGFGAISGMIALGISVALFAWTVCRSLGHCQ